MNTKTGTLFVVSAPSGAGKTSLTEAVVERLKGVCSLEQVTTYTTKKLRENESDKHSLSIAEFQQRAKNGFFLEWSTAYKHYYGSPRSVLDAIQEGKSYILTLDRAGAKRVAELHKDAVLIWVYPENIEVLRQRLVDRGRDTQDQIARRLALAERELREENEHSLYKYHILNDDFEKALREFEAIIQTYLAL